MSARNIENSTVVNLNYLSNDKVPDGSAAEPSITFAADTNTGIYRVGNDQLGISTAGVNTGTFSNSKLTLTGRADEAVDLILQSTSGSLFRSAQNVHFITHQSTRGSGLMFSNSADANRKIYFGRGYRVGNAITQTSLIAQNEETPEVQFDQVFSETNITNKNLIWTMTDTGRMGLGEGHWAPQGFIDIGAVNQTLTRRGNPVNAIGQYLNLRSLTWNGTSVGTLTSSHTAFIGSITYTDTTAATITTAATLFINGPPIAGTNMTIPNPWALLVNSGNSFFGGNILGAAGTFGTPSFSFNGDPDTGMYSAGADQIGFSTNGANRMTISASGISTNGLSVNASTSYIDTISTNTSSGGAIGGLRMTTEPQRASGVQWLYSGDATRGLYIGTPYNGGSAVNRFTIQSSTTAFANPGTSPPPNQLLSLHFDTGEFRVKNGTAAAPIFSFIDDTNTGMYSAGADEIGFSTNGVNRMTITNTRLTSNHQLRIPYLSGNPQILLGRPDNSTDMQIFVDSGSNLNIHNRSGASKLILSTNSSSSGVVISDINATNNSLARFEIFGGDGTNLIKVLNVGTVNTDGVVSGQLSMINTNTHANPSYTFIGDTNTGMYRVGADQIGFSTNGVNRMSISNTALTAGDGVKIIAPSLQITTSPTAGHVLTSDASGNATWAAVPAAPVYYKYYRENTAQSVAQNTDAFIVLTSSWVSSPNSTPSGTWAYDASNGEFKVPINGFYSIAVNIKIQSDPTGFRRVRILLNGNVINEITSVANGGVDDSLYLETKQVLTTTDEIVFDVRQNSLDPLNINSFVSFVKLG